MDRGESADPRKRRRVDKTTELPPEDRRLDSLAKLLSVNSECVAVVLIKGQVYVASNELFKHSKTDEGKSGKNYKAINEIIKYFQDIARDKEPSEEEKIKIFSLICSGSRFKEACPTGLDREIAENVFRGMDPKISEIRKFHSSYPELAAQMYTKFMELRQDFFKLAEALKSQSAAHESLLVALRDQDYEVLTREPQSGVHAEVQILSLLVEKNSGAKKASDNITGKIYFGISKLCCLHCHHMLETANAEFTKREIDVELIVRGSHDIDFDWLCPSSFNRGYNSVMRRTRSTATEDELTSIEYTIGRESALVIEAKLEETKHAGAVSMEADHSGSDSEEAFLGKMHDKKEGIETELELLRESHDNPTKTEDRIRILTITNQLYSMQDFVNFHNNPSHNDEDIERVFFVILGKLNDKLAGSIGNIEGQQLLNILNDSKLVNEYFVGIFGGFDFKEGKLIKLEETSFDPAKSWGRMEQSYLGQVNLPGQTKGKEVVRFTTDSMGFSSSKPTANTPTKTSADHPSTSHLGMSRFGEKKDE